MTIPTITGRSTLSMTDVTTAAAPAPTCEGANGRNDSCCASGLPTRDAEWHQAARMARRLAWASLGWMSLEGVVGLTAAIRAGSVSLLGWALSSVVEGLASIIVIWRFSGTRTLAESSERRARKGTALSFWLLAPYIALDSIHDLVSGERPVVSVAGMIITASSVIIMPVLGRTNQRLGARLESGSTTGEGVQNWLCAATGAAVLIDLAANAAVGVWWLDPLLGLAIAAAAVWQGIGAWRGDDCCQAPPP